MSVVRLVAASFIAVMLLGACAKPPRDHAALSAYAPVRPTSGLEAVSYDPLEGVPQVQALFSNGNLAGRTLAVASAAEIALRPGEVVLTFDDGPRPGKTDQILATLDEFGVKATFLMLGSAAEAHPQLARRVAAHGHAIGSHTYDHVDLRTLERQAAVDEIARGERAIARVLAGAGQGLSPFFRFPYLAESGFLRTSLMQGGVVVLDVDIDSKDYYDDAPETVADRTLERLAARGSGIILFHDIHQRTVDLLPAFLTELEARGYSVVRLVARDDLFGRDLITAGLPAGRGSL